MTVNLESHAQLYINALCAKQDRCIFSLLLLANCKLHFQDQKVASIQWLGSWYQLCRGVFHSGGHLPQDSEED